MHPDVVTAAISYSWGWWSMPSELEKPIDMENSAAEFYLVLGLRDFTHHITTVRDTYERLRAKGYHTIYREFEELGDRSYHPTSNDDAISWATRLRNKNIPPSLQEMNLLEGVPQRHACAGIRILSNVGPGGRSPRRRSAPKAVRLERCHCPRRRGRDLQPRHFWRGYLRGSGKIAGRSFSASAQRGSPRDRILRQLAFPSGAAGPDPTGDRSRASTWTPGSMPPTDSSRQSSYRLPAYSRIHRCSRRWLVC